MASTSMENGDKKQHLGIPCVEFIAEVEAYLQKKNIDNIEVALRESDELYRKYKLMEQSLVQRRNRLKQQVPDIESNLEVIRELQRQCNNETDSSDKKDGLITSFLLSDGVYAKARLQEPPNRVGVWLGANCMLEYTLDEACALMEKNQSAAQKSLQELESDLDYLKDQITTSEVNMARLYNHGVHMKQQQKAAAAQLSGADKKT